MVRTQRSMKTVAVGVLAMALGLAGQAFAYETVSIPTLPPPNIVDGDLSDPCWEKAYRAEPFTAIKPGGAVTEGTVAYLFCTADKLYIGAKCSFADYSLREQIVNDGSGSVFAGDCVEMFVDPGDTGNCAHMAVGVSGKVESFGTVAPIRCAVQLYRTHWMMEAEIPFSSIKLDSASYNANWRINVARGNYRKGETSSWSRLENGTFNELAAFNSVNGIAADLVAIMKAQKAAARKDFEIAFDRIVYTDQAEVKATMDFLYAKPITGFAAKATVRDKDGKTVLERSAPLTAFHADFAFPLGDFADGKHVATLAIVNAAGKVVKSGEKTFYKVPPMKDSDNTDRFTVRNHCIYRNGEFFFPIITWKLTASEFTSLEEWRAQSETELSELAEHGFNAGITEHFTFSEEDLDVRRKTKSVAAWYEKTNKALHDAGVTFEEQCRMAQKHGISVIPCSPYQPNDPYATDCFVDHIVRIRKAPNVMMWHTADETDGLVEYNALLNRLYHEIDPTRLTWLNVINAVSDNKDSADVLSTDPYPIPNGRVTAVAAHADRLVLNTKGRPQVGRWLWIQNFGGEGNWTRPPTPDEVKCMSMLAINHGVKGLAFFTWTKPALRNGVRQHPEGMSLFKTFSPFLQKWAPALCQGEVKFQGRQGDLDVLAVVFEGRKVLSVVNVEDKPLSASVKIDGFCDKAFDLAGYGIAVVEL